MQNSGVMWVVQTTLQVALIFGEICLILGFWGILGVSSDIAAGMLDR